MADNNIKNNDVKNAPAKSGNKTEATPVSNDVAVQEQRNENLSTDHGTTTIDDTVVALSLIHI